jgi:two-component system, OmpR family, response regulator
VTTTSASQAEQQRGADPSRAEVVRADGSPVRVLVVDDEPQLADLVGMALRFEGWQVRTAGDGASAVRAAHELRPDVVVLDVMLPDVDGLTLLRRLREEVPEVTKPFSLEEVIARLRGLVRRAGVLARREDPRLRVGDLTMDEEGHEVFRGDDEVVLTATEFELLRLLMRNPRRVLSKAHILDRVWNYDFGGQANVVELYISYLRKKVDAGRQPMIHTVRGVGYVLKPTS